MPRLHRPAVERQGQGLVEFATSGVRASKIIFRDNRTRRYFYNNYKGGKSGRVYVTKTRRTAGKNRAPVYLRKLGPPWG